MLIPIIIPAYEPDENLVELLKNINNSGLGPVILVDDGSGPEYAGIFDTARELILPSGGVLLVQDVNRGKGCALKRAFAYVHENLPDAIGVVTCDSDGQHSVPCIQDVAASLMEHPDALILGSRTFGGEDVPWKSRMGNEITSRVFQLLEGVKVKDTQTGLRGIPYGYLEDCIEISGDRFEYEMKMLTDAAEKIEIIEVPIETIYDSATDHKTHFRSVVDSVRIYRTLGASFLKFIVSSLSSSIIDLGLFTLFCIYFRSMNQEEISILSLVVSYLVIATVLARIISAIYNYLVNYFVVFQSKERIGNSGVRYIFLAIIQMTCSAILVTGFAHLLPIISPTIIKVFVDVFLFFISYRIQKRFVFSTPSR